MLDGHFRKPDFWLESFLRSSLHNCSIMNEWWTGADSIRCWHVQIGNWRTCELCLLVCLTNFYCGCSTREFFVGMIKAKGLVYTVVTRFEMFISQKWITLVLEWSAQNFNILIKINWWLRREGDTYQLFFVCLSDLLTIFQNSSSLLIYWTTYKLHHITVGTNREWQRFFWVILKQFVDIVFTVWSNKSFQKLWILRAWTA